MVMGGYTSQVGSGLRDESVHLRVWLSQLGVDSIIMGGNLVDLYGVFILYSLKILLI